MGDVGFEFGLGLFGFASVLYGDGRLATYVSLFLLEECMEAGSTVHTLSPVLPVKLPMADWTAPVAEST